MKPDLVKVEKIIDEYSGYLRSISDGITEGIFEGVKEGVHEGLKEGVKDGLKEHFNPSSAIIGHDDIGDILQIVRNSAQEGARHIFEENTKTYTQKVCQEIIKRLRKEKIMLSKDELGEVTVFIIEKSEQEAMKKILETLPKNPFVRGIASGIRMALDKSLEGNLALYREDMCSNRRTPRGKRRADKMVTVDELKESVRKSVKILVKEIIGDITYQITKVSTKKVLNKLKEKLKEKALHKLEESLRNISEQGLEGQLEKGAQKIASQLDKSIKRATERITEDSFEGADLVGRIEQGCEKGFRKCLLSPLKHGLIACACILVGTVIVLRSWSPTPPVEQPEPPVGPTPAPSVEQPEPSAEPAPPLVPPMPTPEVKPDLVIIEVWDEWGETGATVYYTIENQGDGEAAQSTTYLFSPGSEERIEDAVEPLFPGQRRDEAFPPYFILFLTGFQADLQADGDNRISESNEENNYIEYRRP